MWPHSVMTRLARSSTTSRQMGHSSTGSSTLEFAAKKLAILKTSSFVVCKDILGDIQWGHLVIMVSKVF